MRIFVTLRAIGDERNRPENMVTDLSYVALSLSSALCSASTLSAANSAKAFRRTFPNWAATKKKHELL